MALMEFTLKDGRRLNLLEVSLADTYMGLLEGSPEKASEHYRRHGLEKKVRRESGDCPVHVFDPGTPALPPVTCTAYFKSFENTDPDVFYSVLLVGWFVESFEGDIRQVVSQGIKELDWSTHAMPIRYDDV